MYTIQNCIKSDVDFLSKGIYIVLEKPETVPPHIILLINGRFFSLSVKGPHLNEDSQTYFKLWNAKNRAILFVKLKEERLTAKEIAIKCTQDAGIMGNGITCLNPIRSFCSSYYSQDFHKHQFIFELLKDLSASELISGYYTLNHESSLITIPSYSTTDIEKAILEAKKKVGA